MIQTPKTSFIFSQTSASLLTLCSLLLIISSPVRSVTENDCFCGARASQVKKNNIDLYGAESTAHIISYIDQSISKFNGLGLMSPFAGQNPKLQALQKEEYKKMVTQSMISKLTNQRQKSVNRNGENLNELKSSYLTTVKFSKNKSQFKTMRLEFMLGFQAVFVIDVTLIEGAKKQFNFKIEQKPYIPGRNWESLNHQEIKKMNFKGINMSRSLSHFDKNQLEVDVCRMMYAYLSKISFSAFAVSLKDSLLQFPSKSKGQRNAIGCKKNVLFRKRFEDQTLIQTIQHTFSSLEKNGHAIRVKLNKKNKSQYMKVVQTKDQENEGQNQDLAVIIEKNEIGDFNDRNFDDSHDEISEQTMIMHDDSSQSISFTNDSGKKTNLVIKDIMDQDLDIESPSNKMNKKEKVPMTYHDGQNVTMELRNRIIQKYVDKKENESQASPDVSEIEHKSQKSKNQPRKQTENSEFLSEHTPQNLIDMLNKSVSQNTSQISKDSFNREIDLENYSHETGSPFQNDTSVIQNVEKKVKKKRVIVLIETIECTKCMNDLNSDAFLSLLRAQTMII